MFRQHEVEQIFLASYNQVMAHTPYGILRVSIRDY